MNDTSLVGRELKLKFVLVTRACASAVGRSSAIAGSALFTVNGISGSFCDQLPTEMYAVARLRAGRFNSPDTLPVFMLLSGQSDIRPCSGPAVGESVTRSGLSQTSVLTSLRKNDPS